MLLILLDAIVVGQRGPIEELPDVRWRRIGEALLEGWFARSDVELFEATEGVDLEQPGASHVVVELQLPDGLSLERTTATFDQSSVPRGLLRSHRLATGVWGVLRVHDGTVRFCWEDVTGPDATLVLAATDSIVIPPEVPHRVELGPDARFAVEFHR